MRRWWTPGLRTVDGIADVDGTTRRLAASASGSDGVRLLPESVPGGPLWAVRGAVFQLFTRIPPGALKLQLKSYLVGLSL
jgi:hypothetical protein